MSPRERRIANPLQFGGYFLAWVETVLVGSLWPVDDALLQTVIICVVMFIAVAYAVACVFMLTYLTVKRPEWLLGPEGFDPSVQKAVFGQRQIQIRPRPEKVFLRDPTKRSQLLDPASRETLDMTKACEPHPVRISKEEGSHLDC